MSTALWQLLVVLLGDAARGEPSAWLDRLSHDRFLLIWKLFVLLFWLILLKKSMLNWLALLFMAAVFDAFEFILDIDDDDEQGTDDEDDDDDEDDSCKLADVWWSFLSCDDVSFKLGDELDDVVWWSLDSDEGGDINSEPPKPDELNEPFIILSLRPIIVRCCCCCWWCSEDNLCIDAARFNDNSFKSCLLAAASSRSLLSSNIADCWLFTRSFSQTPEPILMS